MIGERWRMFVWRCDAEFGERQGESRWTEDEGEGEGEGPFRMSEVKVWSAGSLSY